MSFATMSLATMSLAIIVPRNKFYNRLKQKKYDNSNKRFALFTSSSLLFVLVCPSLSHYIFGDSIDVTLVAFLMLVILFSKF